MTGMTTFAVQYTYDQRADLRDEIRAAHLDYLLGLAERGLLLGSGPYADGPDGALLVFAAADRAVLDGLVAADPFAQAGIIADLQVREWTLVLGPWAAGLAG
jgi:uncharacterized protein YciI